MLRFVSRALSLYRGGRALPTRALTEEQLLAKYGINQKALDYNDIYCKHRQQVAVPHTNAPKVAPNAFVAPCATLAGNVEVWDNSSIWYGCVIRADVRLVRIGARTNIQDRTVITEAHHPLHADHDGSTIVGHNVTVGHRCILRACTIEDESHIGMGSILMEGSYVEGGSMIGAGSVLLPHTRVPSGQLWLGNPARYVRDLTTQEQIWITTTAEHYSRTADTHAVEFILPYAMDAVHEAEQLGYTIGYQESIDYR